MIIIIFNKFAQYNLIYFVYQSNKAKCNKLPQISVFSMMNPKLRIRKSGQNQVLIKMNKKKYKLNYQMYFIKFQKKKESQNSVII